MLLPALAKAKKKAQQTSCRNNLKQLELGLRMYLDVSNDVFPACGSRNTFGFQAEDWIYWRNQPAYPLKNSLIVAHLGTGSTSNLFRCPADKDDRDRIASNTDGNGIYPFSYSMTSYDIDRGITSVKQGTVWHPFKFTQIKNPAKKIVLAEEQSMLSGPECSDPTGDVINDGRYVPGGGNDELTSRHVRKADVGFCDGHVETVKWQFGDDTANSDPNL